MKYANRYEPMQLLGEGGMARVEEALDHETGRIVALKRLRGERADDPLDRLYFERERTILADLSLDCVPRLLDAGEDDLGVPYIVMELIDGWELDRYLRRERIRGAESAVLVARAAEALEKVHQAGVVHRDIKPDNFLVDRDGRVHVIDFGISSRADLALPEEESDMIIGTLAYIAPERIIQTAAAGHDPRCDVYSLGIVLYSLLTGHVPYLGMDTESTLDRIVWDDLPVPSVDDVPASIAEVAMRAVAKDREHRPATAAEFAEAVLSALQPDPIRPAGDGDRSIAA